MELDGKYLLGGAREEIWNALHDVDLLARCVPGCREIVWIGSDTLEAEIELRMGRNRHAYRGRVRIADAVEPVSYRLLFGETGRGNSVNATIELVTEGRGTRLSYSVEAALDGYLARLGTPLARTIARRIAKRFFQRLDAALAAPDSG